MTVEQLIAVLQKMPQDKTVRIGMCDPSNGSVIHNIDEVRQENGCVDLWWIY